MATMDIGPSRPVDEVLNAHIPHVKLKKFNEGWKGLFH